MNFGRLKTGRHVFSFDIDKTFFAPLEDSIIQDCKTQVTLEIDKTRLNLMTFNFSIQGDLMLDCDRCLETLPYPIDTSYSFMLKLKEVDPEGETEDDDEIVFLGPNDFEIDVSKHIYDFHTLSVPFKRECQQVSTRCREIENMLSSGSNAEDTDSSSDPRWNDLKKLLNKK